MDADEWRQAVGAEGVELRAERRASEWIPWERRRATRSACRESRSGARRSPGPVGEEAGDEERVQGEPERRATEPGDSASRRWHRR